MQGYILNIKKAKNEDTVVSILTRERIVTLYRFYGARHSIVTTGYKIDFEMEQDSVQFMPKLRNIIHLGYPWITDMDRMRVWQNFIALLYRHLKDIELPGRFYFDMLESCASIWHLQNPKRGAIEAYLRLLEHEGRLHTPDYCFSCGRKLEGKSSLIRAFLPAHPECVIAPKFETKRVARAIESLSTIELDDKEVESMWLIMGEGF